MLTDTCMLGAVTNHGLEELEQQMFEQSRNFFALPDAAKLEIKMNDNLRCCSGHLRPC